MKRRHYGVLVIALIGLSVGAVALDAYQNLGGGVGARQRFRLKSLAITSVPGPQMLREMESLDSELQSLAHPTSSDISQVNLGLFGYKPVEKGKYTAAGRRILLPSGIDYSLSLAFSAGTNRFCVIDGFFYKEGSVLPDGSQVARIEPHRVLVKKERFEHWIPVNKKVKSEDHKGKKTGERK